ncbi:MAG: T9SS C-terminal target domain-containing protein, partial [Bacteroidetes bacterium]
GSHDIVLSQSWTRKAPLNNYGRAADIGCSVNGKGYVGLGKIEDGSYINDLWEYDTITDLWTRKSNFPGGGRCGCSAYSIKGKIYVCFGIDNSLTCRNDLWVYDPLYDTWTPKAYFPGQARYNARGFVMGDSVLYIGTGTYDAGNDYLFDFWKYSPATNKWTQKADFPGNKRQAAVSFEIDGIGFLGTGLYDSYTPTKDFWKYNPVYDQWTRIADFPAFRFGMVSFVLNHKGYVGTGNDYSSYYNEFYKYDSQADSWIQIVSIPTDPNISGVGFTLGNKGYAGTGWDTQNCFTDFWQFDPDKYPFIVDEKHNMNIKIYPNPVSDKTTIDLQNIPTIEMTTISIYTIQGLPLLQQPVMQKKTILDISKFAPGVYIVKIQDPYNTKVTKIIKE